MTLMAALAIVRPNELDRQVSAIPAHALLTQSPFNLVDPARAAAAAHLEQTQVLLWITALALQIAVLAWFWSSGRSAQLRDGLRARIGSEFWVRFCFGATLALLDKAVALIPLAMQYRFLFIMRLSDQLFRWWLLDWLLGTLAALAVAGLLAACVLWLADRTHQWYVYTLAAVVGVCLFVAFLTPFVAVPPLEPAGLTRSLAADADRLKQATGIDAPIVEQRIGSRTRVGAAYVAGLGGSQRIVISDTMLDAESEPEMRFIIARSMAWIAGNFALQLALVQAGFIVFGAALAVTIADRIGFRRDDDPVSRLALLGALMGLVYLVAAPFYNSYTRNLDIAADRMALATTRDPADAIRLQVRRADQALLTVCPGTIAYWYLAQTPPPGPRISALQGVPDACANLRQ